MDVRANAAAPKKQRAKHGRTARSRWMFVIYLLETGEKKQVREEEASFFGSFSNILCFSNDRAERSSLGRHCWFQDQKSAGDRPATTKACRRSGLLSVDAKAYPLRPLSAASISDLLPAKTDSPWRATTEEMLVSQRF